MSENTARDIERFGWHAEKFMAEGDLPVSASTTGFFRTFQCREIIIFDLPLDVMHALLNLAGEELQEGTKYESGVPSSAFLKNHDGTSGGVLPERYDEHFGQAIEFYGHAAFSALQ